MLLWLPLMQCSSLAVAVTLQMPGNPCPDHTIKMPDINKGVGVQHNGLAVAGEQDNLNCNGACHLFCTSYLATSNLELVVEDAIELVVTPYQVSFRSITFPPLPPPPLVHV